MSKNKVTLTVTVAARTLMPDESELTEWATSQYERALEIAGRNGDGTVTTFKSDFPCVQPEKM